MFSIGDYVVCGNKGVCRVENIAPLEISDTDNNEDYYILKPIYSPGSTVYISMSTADEKLRPVLTKNEADSLVKMMPGIPDIAVDNDKQLEGEYKNCIRSNDATELLSSSRPSTTDAKPDLRQDVRRPLLMPSISEWQAITSTESSL